MSKPRDRLGLAVVMLAALAAAASASAATAGYVGKVKNGGSISFRVSGSSVTLVRASVSVLCVSAAPARSGIEVYIVAPSGSVPLGGSGKFTAVFKAPKQKFYSQGKPVQTLYSVKATVTGTVHGGSASGTAKVTYNKFWMAYNPATGLYQLTLAACFVNTTWAATGR